MVKVTRGAAFYLALVGLVCAAVVVADFAFLFVAIVVLLLLNVHISLTR